MMGYTVSAVQISANRRTAFLLAQALSLSDRGNANLRVNFSVLPQRGSTRSVVAADSVSANADWGQGQSCPSRYASMRKA
jgi:hypothetical protein